MRKLAQFVVLLLICLNTVGQKPPIDNTSYKNWPMIRSYGISNDGKYIYYEYRSLSTSSTLVFSTSDGRLKKEFPKSGGGRFTEDSQYLTFYTGNSITLLNTSTNDIEHISNGHDIMLPKQGKGRWITYKVGDSLFVRDFKKGKTKNYLSTNLSLFNNEGNILLVQTSLGLKWINLLDDIEKDIFHDRNDNISYLTFDESGRRLAFLTGSDSSTTIHYYEQGMDSASVLITKQTAGIKHNMSIAHDRLKFSKDGKKIFFYLKQASQTIVKDSLLITDKVDIWHYNDMHLQSVQLSSVEELKNRKFIAAFTLNSPKGEVIPLEEADTMVYQQNSGNSFVILKTKRDDLEAYWDDRQIPTYQLISVNSGEKTSFNHFPKQIFGLTLSTDEQFVTWGDTLSNRFYCYEIASGISRDVTPPGDFTYKLQFSDRIFKFPFKLIGWLSGDTALLLCDSYDIWLIDPKGRKKAVNLTAGYGRMNRIMLRSAISSDELSNYRIGDSLLLTGFQDHTKKNGFFKIKIGNSSFPNTGSFESCVFYFPDIFEYSASKPIKAKFSKKYLVEKQSTTEAPNIFVTENFSDFQGISNLSPHSAYNWMTSELIHWNTKNGTSRMGILYRPENFDSTIKYPIIFHYYELKSYECNKYRVPELCAGGLDIPWFVSNGYIVFIPDIWPSRGNTGNSALTSVESAADYLTKRYEWIDKNNMALQGHSFGGYETNYIVTHTNLFKAAQSSAGQSDQISGYGGLSPAGSRTHLYEIAQSNIGSPPWENPEVYIKNSPLFAVRNMNTPLLIMHNKDDSAVPFSQAIEFFIALRRLKKSVWLIQYDDQGHVLNSRDNCNLDFTIRQQQFFNHFLKRHPAPKWLIEGIKAESKGIDSGLSINF